MNENNNPDASLPTADVESNTGNGSDATDAFKTLDTPCRIDMHCKRHRLAGADGLSAKAVIDSLVACGILKNDTTKEITESPRITQEKTPKTEKEETIITITYDQ